MGASTPSSSANPMLLSCFDQLTTPAGHHRMPNSFMRMGPPSIQMGHPHFQHQQHHPQHHQHQQHQQQQQQHGFFQPQQSFFQPQHAYFQSQQSYFIPQANNQMVGCQANGPTMSPPSGCQDQSPFSVSPTTGFDVNEEQMAELLRQSAEDVYED